MKKLLTKGEMCVILSLPLLGAFFVMHIFAYDENSVLREVKHLYLPGGVHNESENNTRMLRMQTKKLRHYQEQEERSRSSRIQQVLPFLP